MSDLVEKVAKAMWYERERQFPERTRVAFDARQTNDIHAMAKAAIATVLREMMAEQPRRDYISSHAILAFAAEHNIHIGEGKEGEKDGE